MADFDAAPSVDLLPLDAEAGTRFVIIRAAVAFLVMIGLAVTASYFASLMSSGSMRFVLQAVWTLLLGTPVMVAAVRSVLQQQRQTVERVTGLHDALLTALEVAEQAAAEREFRALEHRFERQVSNAMELAEGEPGVADLLQRALAEAVPESAVEVLLADNSHAHLVRMATASPTGAAPGCGVDSPDHCPAARRAQTQRFEHSEDLDACPRLRGRADGSLSALCVPLSIMGRTVGVIHATAEPGTIFPDSQVHSLETLAKLTGARLGLLRVMAKTQLQASTDNLTGLLNRRAFEDQFSARRREAQGIAVAMADLDRFKELNDTYGHDTGDRALRLFAQTVSDALRTGDLVCRHGGEEFVLAFVNCDGANAVKALDAIRARLDAAITVAGLPKFTVSFGVIEGHVDEDLPGMLLRADAALFDAKRNGRDRVAIHLVDDNAADVEERVPNPRWGSR